VGIEGGDGPEAARWRGPLPARRPIREERTLAEAGVAWPAVGVEDPELGPAAGRPVPVAADRHLDPLADDVPTEPDPRSASELEPETDRRAEQVRRTVGSVRHGWLEDHEQAAGPPGQRRQPAEPLGDPARLPGPGGQIDEQQVDRSGTEQRAGQ
jgi:hypothetical protein